MFKTKQVKKYFGGVKAVDGISIEVAPGKITSIIGPNGSGKTTLTNVLTGMLPLEGGAVIIENNRHEKLQAYHVRDHGITRTFQNVRLFEQMTVLDNVLVVLTKRTVRGSLFERNIAEHVAHAESLLRKVDLYKKRNDLAANLSYGQRKLLEIARALAVDAKIYFFDEPYAGLFKEMVKIVSGVLRELRDTGRAVVLIEHNMDLIRELSDHVIVMDEGKLLAQGTAEKVLSDRDVIEAYLGE